MNENELIDELVKIKYKSKLESIIYYLEALRDDSKFYLGRIEDRIKELKVLLK